MHASVELAAVHLRSDAIYGRPGVMKMRPLYLKPRGAEAPVEWEEYAVDAPDVGAATPLEEADFVALDIETTGNRPFLVLEVGAERFRLTGPLAFFDTLVDCRAPINPYARRRHQIDRSMLIGAPEFGDVRSGFLRFAKGAVLVEHSHDAFDTWLVGRGLNRPLEHPIVDTTALARLVLALPSGQTPGLATLVEALAVEGIQPSHAALGDARATAAVFRELVRRSQNQLGWRTVGDLVSALPRLEIDRSALEGRSSRKASSEGRAAGGPARTGQPRSDEPAGTRGATSREPRGRRGRSSQRRRSGSSGSPGG
jgi:DNA polymerase III epsilon subunit-like protein